MILNSPTISGSLTVTGNIITSGSITLSGSVASASFAATASFVALAQSASYVLTAQTASFVANAQTASFVALAQSASNAVSAATASFANAFTVASTLTAQTLVVQTITSSVDFVTGSTRFGSILGNTHVFTGSVNITGSANLTGSLSGTSATFSGNVGIGVSPTNKLDILGTSGTITQIKDSSTFAGLIIDAHSSSTPFTRFSSSGTGKFELGYFGNKFYFNNNVGVNDTDAAMVITSGGNVGIAITSPVDTLDVNGALRIRKNTPNFTAAVDNAIIDYVPTSVFPTSPVLRIVSLGTSSIGANIQFTTGTSTSLVDAMRITSSGNVGIGTSSPVTNVDINSAISGAYTTSSSQAPLRVFNVTNAGGINSSVISFQCSTDNSASNPVARIGVVGETAGSNNGAMIMMTRDGGGVTERMRITSGGYIVTSAVTYGNTSGGAANMFLFGAGDYGIGRSVSSAKYKTQIEDVEESFVSNIYKMRPIWYRSICERDRKDWSHFGFVAEEIAEIEPRLVHWDKDEEGNLVAEGVQYDRITVLLVAEMQKMRSEIQELKAEINELKAQ